MSTIAASTAPASSTTSSRSRWAGRVLTGIPVLFLLFDASLKLADLAVVHEAGARLGLPDSLSRGLGLLEIAMLALYLVPRTAVLGAALLTGYLGGAVAIHARIGDPLVSHTFFPMYVGLMFWVGLALRDARVRALLSPVS